MADKKAKVGAVKYLGQVRQEGRKVVWPTMNETMITTLLVLVMMVIFGVFFFFVDWIAANGTQFLLSIGVDSGANPGAGG